MLPLGAHSEAATDSGVEAGVIKARLPKTEGEQRPRVRLWPRSRASNIAEQSIEVPLLKDLPAAPSKPGDERSYQLIGEKSGNAVVLEWSKSHKESKRSALVKDAVGQLIDRERKGGASDQVISAAKSVLNKATHVSSVTISLITAQLQPEELTPSEQSRQPDPARPVERLEAAFEMYRRAAGKVDVPTDYAQLLRRKLSQAINKLDLQAAQADRAIELLQRFGKLTSGEFQQQKGYHILAACILRGRNENTRDVVSADLAASVFAIPRSSMEQALTTVGTVLDGGGAGKQDTAMSGDSVQ